MKKRNPWEKPQEGRGGKTNLSNDAPREKTQLIPLRYSNDLFICDVSDAVLKDIMPEMEHPFYSLSKKPDTNIRRYEHNGNWLEVTPSVKGLATIYDKDILIYCISQLMAKIKACEPINQRVRINSRDLLMFTNRGTGGKDYAALAESLDRLEGTRIRTNIMTGDEEQADGFGLIDATSIRRKQGLDGRLLWCEVKLSDWVFNAIKSNEVLALHPNYFRLRKPLERRVYEIVRKHCGQQAEWKISLALLLKKSGSKDELRNFRQMVLILAKYNHLPDYQVRFNPDDDMVSFINKNTMFPKKQDVWDGQLTAETYHDARQLVPGWDIYYIEGEWREWMTEMPVNPDKAFIGFCRKWFEKRGKPA